MSKITNIYLAAIVQNEMDIEALWDIKEKAIKQSMQAGLTMPKAMQALDMYRWETEQDIDDYIGWYLEN